MNWIDLRQGMTDQGSLPSENPVLPPLSDSSVPRATLTTRGPAGSQIRQIEELGVGKGECDTHQYRGFSAPPMCHSRKGLAYHYHL
jgi:hypothetical protein